MLQVKAHESYRLLLDFNRHFKMDNNFDYALKFSFMASVDLADKSNKMSLLLLINY